MEERIYTCPVCESADIYWQLSGGLTCNKCNLIYRGITKETYENPEVINNAKHI